MFVGYSYLFVIKWLRGNIIWVSIGVTALIVFSGGFYTFFYARKSYDPKNPTFQYLASFSYILWASTALIILSVVLSRKHIKTGIKIFKTTAQFVTTNSRIYFVPLVVTVILSIWMLFWLLAAVYIFSIGTPSPREDFPYITEIKWSKSTRSIFIYHVFALFWINSFIIGCTQFAIGAAACFWYFESKTETKGTGTVGRGIKLLLRYHVGSVALGTLTIAFCQIFRWTFEYYRKRMSVMKRDSKVGKVMFTTTGWFLWLLEHCIKYFSKNAYI